MKDALRKADEWLFDKISAVVVAWVKKQGGKKHKYDFFLKFEAAKTYLFTATVCGAIVLAHVLHRRVPMAFFAFFLIFILIGQSIVYTVMTWEKQEYDRWFAARKNPEVYKAMKDLCEWRFDLHRPRRQTMIVFIAASSLLVPFSIPFQWTFLPGLYDRCIFDFDAPDKKDKEKEPAKLTEIAMAAFRRATETLNPQGSS